MLVNHIALMKKVGNLTLGVQMGEVNQISINNLSLIKLIYLISNRVCSLSCLNWKVWLGNINNLLFRSRRKKGILA